MTTLEGAVRELSAYEREMARAALRRFVGDVLSPAELAIEIERWEQMRALFAGDLKASDFTEYDADTLAASVAFADGRLTELERQAKRILRTGISGGALPKVDFAKAKYVDLIGLVEAVTAQPARTQPNGSALFQCPWHEDWEPSLRVYPPGGGWFCFQCGKGGADAASFCAEFFQCSQIHGLRWVEELCDVPEAI